MLGFRPVEEYDVMAVIFVSQNGGLQKMAAFKMLKSNVNLII